MQALTASRFYCASCIRLTLQFCFDSTLAVLPSRRHLVSTSSTKFVTWLALYYRQYGGTRIWECNHENTLFVLIWADFELGEVSFERGRFSAARSGPRLSHKNSFSDLKIGGFMRVYFVEFCSTLNTHIIRYQHKLVEPWPERAALNLSLSNETSPSPKFAHIRTNNVFYWTHVSGQIVSVYSALHYPCLPP